MKKDWDEKMKRAFLKAYGQTLRALAEEADPEDLLQVPELVHFAQFWIRELGKMFHGAKEG